MEQHIEKLYEAAPRFDEGIVVHEEPYRSAKREQIRLFDQMADTFGPVIVTLLDDYTDTFYEEMECEAQHFFREGYLAAKRETALPFIPPAP